MEIILIQVIIFNEICINSTELSNNVYIVDGIELTDVMQFFISFFLFFPAKTFNISFFV